MAESDRELEEKARAQAAAIAQAQAAAHVRGFAKLFGGRPQPDGATAAAQQPGRELLLWQLKHAPDTHVALELCFALLRDGRFAATVPQDRPAIITTFEARRKWNEAAKEWSEMGGGNAQTWLKCDRKLMLWHRPEGLRLCVDRRDLCVRFDPGAGALVPERIEGLEAMEPSQAELIVSRFPNLTVPILLEGMRNPNRGQPAPLAGSPDAYIADGPLVATLEVFMQDKKKKKEEKEDPGKGFATWLASLIKGK